MRFEDIAEKTVALLLMDVDANGQHDWTVVAGTVSQSHGTLLFHHASKPEGFPLPDDALQRMKPTPTGAKETMLGADIFLPLSVGPKPEGAAGVGMIATGLPTDH
jgi:hypothetical protein